MQGIYKIQNLVDGKTYIGSSVNIVKRFSNHKYTLNCGLHANLKLQNAWSRYGESKFLFAIVEFVNDISQLDIREQH